METTKSTHRNAAVWLAGAALVAGVPLAAQAASPALPVDAFRLGYTWSHFDRQEQSFDRQKGGLNGLNVGYELITKRLYLQTELHYSAGTVKYTGGVQYVAGGQLQAYPYSTHIDEKLLSNYADIGLAFRPFSARNVIAPFIGAGFRYHADQTSAGRVTLPGLGTERVNPSASKRWQIQGRVGLMDRYTVNPRLHLQLTALGTYNAYGRLSTRAGQSGRYKGGLGWSVDGMADYKLWRFVGLYADVGYTRVHTSRINLGGGYIEPKASTGDLRATVGVELGTF